MSDANEMEVELTALQSFARDHTEKRAFSKAVSPLQRCIVLCRQLYGAESRSTIDAMEELGVCLYLCQLYRDALFQLRPVYDWRTSDGGDGPATVLYSAKFLGLTLSELGLHAQARPVLEDAVRLAVKLYGQEGGTTLLLKSRLARCLCCLHEWQALVYLGDTVCLDFEIKAGREYGHSLKILRSLAIAQYNLGQYATALSTVFRALSLAKGRTGLGKVEALDDLRLASRCLLKLKRYDEAVATCEKVLEIAKHTLGEKSGYCSMIVQELGSVRFKSARLLKHDQRSAAAAALKVVQSVG